MAQDTTNPGAAVTGLEIAVIGMSGRFPGAENIHRYQENLKNGIESISFFSSRELEAAGIESRQLEDPNYVKAFAILEDIEYFDAGFFGYTPGEADITDPQMRIFHESVWNVLEDAGYCPDAYEGLIGIYAGAGAHPDWEFHAYSSGKAADIGEYTAMQFADKDFLCTLVSYRFNLKGPAVVVQTACSTSLVAIHMACQGILNGECDMALAGGVNITMLQAAGHIYREGMISSPDGHCRAFDAKSKGTIGGDGLGIVVLKRLENAIRDGDYIYALVKGSAINNDGLRKVGFNAPSIEGQAEVIIAAQEMAEVEPESITYLEAHGTGTDLGDPVEIDALKLAFDTDKKGYCAIGSVKTNLGHLNAAAGIAGFIKTVLAIYHRQIPPSLHFESPNPKIDFENSPFYVNTGLKEWKSPGYPLRAGVSSFGIGGTNAHIILEEAPDAQSAERQAQSAGRKYQLILLSAKTETALDKMTENLAAYLQENPDIHPADVAYTLQLGRKAFRHRRMLVCPTIEEAKEILSLPESEKIYTHVNKDEQPDPRIIFMFPGQGSQYVNMGLELYRTEPIFREQMDRCFEILKSLMGLDIKGILYPLNRSNRSHINQTEIAQPLIFIIEYALAKLLIAWGIEPYAMIGHSIGEYVAACISGVFSLENALEIVAIRGQLMQQMPVGSMLGVPLSEKELIPLLNPHDDISLAAVNSSSHCVVSGPHEAIESFARQLKEKGYKSRPLHTSHAFHSKMMDPILAEFENRIKDVKPGKKTGIPYISNVTGTWASIGQTATPRYWAGHMRNTVRFYHGITELLKNQSAVFIEMGPGRSLGTFVRKHEDKKPGQKIIELIRHPKEEVPDTYYLLKQVGHLWIYGVGIDWVGFYGEEKRCRIPLPGYPFKGQRYRLATTFQPPGPRTPQKREAGKKSDIAQWFYIPTWKLFPLVDPLDRQEHRGEYLLLVNEEKLVSRLVELQEQSNPGVTVVKIGEEFTRLVESEYAINPRQENDYHTLFRELKSAGKIPRKIIHCWNVTGNENKRGRGENDTAKLEQAQDLGFYSLLYLARAIGSQVSHGDGPGIEIIVVTDGMQAVTGEEILDPRKALVRGAVQVIPREYPNIRCRSIDIDNPLPDPASRDQGKLIENLIKNLEKEIEMNGETADIHVAYRNNLRLIPTFEQTPLEMTGAGGTILKEKGVYLVTGGLGGIGLELARYLAETVKARLILTGRTSFPGPGEWDRWLETHGTADKTAVRIRKIREMEAAGAEVSIHCADAADMQQMRQVAARAQEQFGGINGIIHSAGLPDGGLISTRTRDMSEAVMGPKVKGTLVLDALFNSRSSKEQLDFMVLCSSLSSVLAPVGQVAYCAANAFLDTYAMHKTAGNNTHTVSIDWDTWQEVGMAVKAVEELTAAYTGSSLRESVMEHPLFEKCSGNDPDREIFISTLHTGNHWVLEEHRIKGTAVLPGTAYLEMARAAVQHRDNSRTLELKEVYFLTPLIVKENEKKDIRTILKKEGKETAFSIMSRANTGEDRWIEHTQGKTRVIPGEEPGKYNIEEIESKIRGKEIILQPGDWPAALKEARDSGSYFGPRWNCLRRVKTGETQAFGYLELPSAFVRDREFYKLHPALLDIATGLLRIFQHQNESYFPFYYKRIKIKGPLPHKVFCLARSAGSESTQKELLTYDITIMDEQGRGLVEIEGYSLKKWDPEEIREPLTSGDTMKKTPREAGQEGLKNGLLPAEGVEVFKRVLANRTRPRVLVSTMDLNGRIKESYKSIAELHTRQLPGETDAVPKHPRPELSTRYAAPKTGTQRLLAHIWQQFLGIQPVGINDDFFELGGDSLKVMTVSAKIHKELEVQIPLTEFFNRPTIKKLDQYVDTAGKHTYSAIEPAEEKEYYSLSSSQERLYMLQQMDPDSIAYNIPNALVLEGELHLARLKKVFQTLIDRHESLRTSFIIIDGEVVQKVHDKVEFKIRDLATGDRRQGTGDKPAAHLPSQFVRPFDLSRTPLLRMGLVNTGKDTHLLITDMHHIITDGVSTRLFVEEFMALYADEKLPYLKLRYKDYSTWQNSEKEKKRIEKQAHYWLEEFKGEIPVLHLPYDYNRPVYQGFEGNHLTFEIGGKETRALKELALKENATLYMLLFSIFNLLLSKLSGQEDIIIGTPTAARTHADLRQILGMFVNTLALRHFPNGEKTFKTFLEEIKKNTLKAFENQDYRFEDLIEKVEVKRDTSRNPLFDVMFTLQNMEIPTLEIPGLTLKPHAYENNASKFDITLIGFESGQKLVFSIEYSTKLFKKETIQGFANYFNNIVSAVLAAPGKKIGEIEIISREERERILIDFNDTDAEYPWNKTIHHLFEEQAEKNPGNIAVVGWEGQHSRSTKKHGEWNMKTGEHQITYRKLNEKSNQLARLLRDKGVTPGTIIGIIVERSIKMIIGILGILKIGGCYLPIDPEYPKKRIKYMVEESNAQTLLTQNHLSNLNRSRFKGEILEIDNDGSGSNMYTGIPINPDIIRNQGNPAYIIYTSGSTGKPKGVLIEHLSVVNLAFSQKKRFKINERERILQFSSICFDASVEQIFIAFFSGAVLVLIDKNTLLHASQFDAFVSRHSITHLHAVPSFLENMKLNDMTTSRLKRVISGGDVCPTALVKKWSKYCDFYNEYGPTETTVTSIEMLVKEVDETLPNVLVGKPIDNTVVYLFDKWMCLVPPGVSGQLYIGGKGVSRGYLNRPELTANRFIFNPFIEGEHLYCTGDLARWSTNGNMEFLGRIDQQLKIRGFRIEPGEIENQLLSHKEIKQTAVISREVEGGSGNSQTDRYLCAYIVPEAEGEVSGLREYLSNNLPDYMIPSYFMMLEKLPLTAAGKVDRKSLPVPVPGAGKRYAAPRDEVDKKLVEIWSAVLFGKISDSSPVSSSIGIDDNFFELGGHSLRVTNVASKIHQQFNVRITIAEMFKKPTIRDLALYIKEAKRKSEDKFIPIEATENKEFYPLSSAQKRLFFLEQLEDIGTSYNIPSVHRLKGKSGKKRYEDCFKALIKRHEALRTSFELINNHPVQRVHDEVGFEIEYYEPESSVNNEGEEREEVEKMIQNFVRPFNLAKAPLLRVGFILFPGIEDMLLFDMHHIIGDGTSTGILIDDFKQLYSGEKLPLLKVQYKDFSIWQNNLLETGKIKSQENYWLNLLSGEIPVLDILPDNPRPPVLSFEGGNYRFFLEKEYTEKYLLLSEEMGATLYMNLLASINVLFFKYTHMEDIIVGTGIMGRPHVDLQKIVGMFVNTLVMRNYPRGDKSYWEFFREVKENSLNAFENQDVQFEELVRQLNLERDPSRNPIFDVTFVVQNFERSTISAPGMTIEPYIRENKTSKFDLTLFAYEDEVKHRLVFNLEYAAKLFERKTVEKIANHFIEIIKQVVRSKHIMLRDISLTHALLDSQAGNIKDEPGNFEF